MSEPDGHSIFHRWQHILVPTVHLAYSIATNMMNFSSNSDLIPGNRLGASATRTQAPASSVAISTGKKRQASSRSKQVSGSSSQGRRWSDDEIQQLLDELKKPDVLAKAGDGRNWPVSALNSIAQSAQLGRTGRQVLRQIQSVSGHLINIRNSSNTSTIYTALNTV